ncbi:MAG TPA: hypothetical protein VN736_08850 [Candidatus Limnocylindrales bacterium]|nr:hypothetical protein [Candidatus Limnocylindrales bacterium]
MTTLAGDATEFWILEALSLRWNDVEWFGKGINVHHAIWKRRGRDGAQKWEWH